MTQGPIQCPVCGRADSCQRISAIVGNGTRTSVTQQSFFSAWANNYGRRGIIVPQRYTTQSVSGVSQRLAAPGKPLLPLDRNFWTSVAISAGLGFVINVGGSPISGALTSGILGGIGYYIFNTVRNWGHLQKARQMHQGRLAQYYESYYCKRDDVCFMPGVYFAQPEQFKNWLFQYH